MKTVYVLFGNAGFGKDTIADLIIKQHPGMRKLGFADPIKETAINLLGIPREVAFGPASVKDTFKVYDKTVRHWLRWIGEIGRKNVSPLVWVHRFCDDILRDNNDVICADARHWNELSEPAMYLAARGEVLVRNILVYRPNHPVDLTHASETEVVEMREQSFAGKDLFHAAIINDGTLDDLYKTVNELITALD